ncbi:acetylcholine receptor subunit alpha-type acr-16 [Eurytemora carolleeae]|uniref:acetylcholine receptor subunit alpha-type acr-16 n=1 Tax=Eurytemora carolleeae TaxID=1294199 RepID=UPI000C7784AE|nr:acetylcholine receptor subunit alpha-type acr-16 [Eurytemora carolleeae]|eukprot:XP_023344309.1 acetylcholine receptor subunit alpha-type acr-16-like [Eurytemora affinis]
MRMELMRLGLFMNCISFSLSSMHERRLLNDLFLNYNKLERPVNNESEPVQLSVSISLQQIVDLDEKNQIMTSNIWLNLDWHDHALMWNFSEYGGVKDIRVPPKNMWRPDLLLYNSANEAFDATFPTNIVVKYDGSVSQIPPGIFKSTCTIDITWFPFDDQSCDLKFGTWTYDGFYINLTSLDEGVDSSGFQDNGEWQLLSASAQRNVVVYECCPAPYIDITATITLRRRTLYYFSNLIGPCVLIASMAVLGFNFPPDSGEKVTLEITVLMSLTFFMNMVSELQPPSSETPLIGTYFSCIMIMVASSVVCTIMILNYHHRLASTHSM